MQERKKDNHIQAFQAKKTKILEELASETPDASPKGNVDTRVWPLIQLLNSQDGIVTTSSCSGRISCFLEGEKTPDNVKKSGPILTGEYKVATSSSSKLASFGGKGGNGKWLFVSHDPLNLDKGQENDKYEEDGLLNNLFGGLPSISYSVALTTNGEISRSKERYVHLKFEPLILHILTANLQIAHQLLSCALAASFRESGIVNTPGLPVVAVRTNGLSFDAPVGIFDSQKSIIMRLFESKALLPLLELSNLRFHENIKRMETLEANFRRFFEIDSSISESKEERALRKRTEGLKRQMLEASASKRAQTSETNGVSLQALFDD